MKAHCVFTFMHGDGGTLQAVYSSAFDAQDLKERLGEGAYIIEMLVDDVPPRTFMFVGTVDDESGEVIDLHYNGGGDLEEQDWMLCDEHWFMRKARSATDAKEIILRDWTAMREKHR